MNKNPLSQWFNIDSSRLESDLSTTTSTRRGQPKENQAPLLRASNTNSILEANVLENQSQFLYDPDDYTEPTAKSMNPPNFHKNSYQEDSKEFVFQLDKSVLPKYFTLNDIRLSVNLSVTKKENGSQVPLTAEDNIGIQVITGLFRI